MGKASVLCYLRVIRRCYNNMQAATFPNKCAWMGAGVHPPALQMLCPTSSSVPDTCQSPERRSPPFSATGRSQRSMLHGGLWPCCSPCISPGLTLGARSGAKLLPALPLLEHPLQPGSAPNSCSSPRAQHTFHFRIYLLQAFNLLLPYRPSVHLPYLTTNFEWS